MLKTKDQDDILELLDIAEGSLETAVNVMEQYPHLSPQQHLIMLVQREIFRTRQQIQLQESVE